MFHYCGVSSSIALRLTCHAIDPYSFLLLHIHYPGRQRQMNAHKHASIHDHSLFSFPCLEAVEKASIRFVLPKVGRPSPSPPESHALSLPGSACCYRLIRSEVWDVGRNNSRDGFRKCRAGFLLFFFVNEAFRYLGRRLDGAFPLRRFREAEEDIRPSCCVSLVFISVCLQTLIVFLLRAEAKYSVTTSECRNAAPLQRTNP